MTASTLVYSYYSNYSNFGGFSSMEALRGRKPKSSCSCCSCCNPSLVVGGGLNPTPWNYPGGMCPVSLVLLLPGSPPPPRVRVGRGSDLTRAWVGTSASVWGSHPTPTPTPHLSRARPVQRPGGVVTRSNPRHNRVPWWIQRCIHTPMSPKRRVNTSVFLHPPFGYCTQSRHKEVNYERPNTL